MGPYALLLNRSHYSVLMDKVNLGSEAHSALMRATPPTMGLSYILICSETGVEQLMDLGAQCCPDSVSEIARQFERQKNRSETSVFLIYRKGKGSTDTEWHFHTHCSRWPKAGYVQTRHIIADSESLCSECVERETKMFGQRGI